MDNLLILDLVPFSYLAKYVQGWEKVQDPSQINIIEPSSFVRRLFFLEAKDKTLKIPKIVVKVFSDLRPGKDLDCKISQILSDQGNGPKVYYQNESFRLMEYIDSKPMGIFEMRNPYYVESILQKLYMYNYNKELKEAFIQHFNNEPKSIIRELREVYQPRLKTKIPYLLSIAQSEEHKAFVSKINERMNTPAFETFLSKIAPVITDLNELVVSHNDSQQGNILVSRDDASKIHLIDYEISFFGPNYYDLGSFFGCFMKENCSEVEPAIRFYPQNAITEWELRHYCNYYLSLIHEGQHKGQIELAEYLEREGEAFYENVVCSILTANYLFSTLAILELEFNDSEYDKIQFTLAKTRTMMNEYLQEQEFVKKVIAKKFSQ